MSEAEGRKRPPRRAAAIKSEAILKRCLEDEEQAEEVDRKEQHRKVALEAWEETAIIHNRLFGLESGAPMSADSTRIFGFFQ